MHFLDFVCVKYCFLRYPYIETTTVAMEQWVPQVNHNNYAWKLIFQDTTVKNISRGAELHKF